MKMIVGLGNPGAEYDNTRHNVGFLVVDELARRENILTWQKKMSAEIGEYRAYGEKVLLVKPQTYMNLSGEAVGQIARFYKIDAQDIIVISDDMDLPLGRLRSCTCRHRSPAARLDGQQLCLEQILRRRSRNVERRM